MGHTIKELLAFFAKKDKLWLLPLVLLLVIIGLAIVAAQAAPMTVFLYPII